MANENGAYPGRAASAATPDDDFRDPFTDGLATWVVFELIFWTAVAVAVWAFSH